MASPSKLIADIHKLLYVWKHRVEKGRSEENLPAIDPEVRRFKKSLRELENGIRTEIKRLIDNQKPT